MPVLREIHAGLVLFVSLLCVAHCLDMRSLPCNVSLVGSCPASLYFVSTQANGGDAAAVLFGVNSNMVSRTIDGFLITVNCSCSDSYQFSARTNYVVHRGDTWEFISSKFQSFAVEEPEEQLVESQIVTLDILCGCLEGVEILTYRVVEGDTLYAVSSRFWATVDQTRKLNGIGSSGLLRVGEILFIPSTGLQNLILPNDKGRNKSKSQSQIKLGIIVAAAAVILIFIAIFICVCYRRKSHQKSEASLTEKFDQGLIAGFSSDIATVFPYEEVLEATANFSESQMLGQGSCGSVYFGRLRGNDVAVKKMRSTKSKQFLAELNILCNVHHTNLIELIGYAAGGEFLCLVYEFAQNGALNDHLHTPAIKDYVRDQGSITGQPPLSWTTRVQIALDAAKGLEYIHEHINPYYVHRDVKTSNILLDSRFRAKIADFGLVKLLEHSPEVGTVASKIVGTFGYLAPECVRDGCVTSKGDVYAYGVVLMELITGRPALRRSSSTENTESIEHRSLVDFMLAALEDKDNLIRCIDPNLTHYHSESLVQMALLSKACVEDDRNRRPAMPQIVFHLSHILASSSAWELQTHRDL